MSANIDRRFLDVSLCVQGVANEPPASPAPVNGTQWIVGAAPTGAFAGMAAHSVARYNASKSAWRATAPKQGQMELLNVADGTILSWDGTAWRTVGTLGGGSSGGGQSFKVETIALSAEQATAKKITLAETPSSATDVFLAACGIVQAASVDYSVTGKEISWGGLGLDDIGMGAGDVCVVGYPYATV
ncbi:MAG: DUF2793 domain-containing protein [Synergistaceae bacterium]|nr:DUF2793 domain-containing protein [Synergistaceae bacterium]